MDDLSSAANSFFFSFFFTQTSQFCLTLVDKLVDVHAIHRLIPHNSVNTLKQCSVCLSDWTDYIGSVNGIS